jgi:hypothetical protein
MPVSPHIRHNVCEVQVELTLRRSPFLALPTISPTKLLKVYACIVL